MNETILEALEAREELEELMKKRRRRKKILAFVLAVAILVTFAVPLGMMMPIREQEHSDKTQKPPVYSVNIDIGDDVNA